MNLSDKSDQEFKTIFEKEHGKKLSDSEARESAENLASFVEILYNQAQIEHRRKMRLKKEKVKGFYLESTEGPYTCGICGETRFGNEIWWNVDGLRCINCWRNIKAGVIPPLKHRHDNDDTWFQNWQISSDYGIHPSTVRKLRKEGLLHGRDLKRKDGTIYCTVYLVSENKNFLKKYPKKPKVKVEFINTGDKKV